MDEEVLVITLPKKTEKKEKINPQALDGFVELKSEHIKHLHGSWLKFISKKTKKINIGGFLDKIEDGIVFLRCPSKANISVIISENIFFVKEKDANYLSLLDILQEHKKNTYQLSSYKQNIIKMIADGKLKFIK